MSPRQGSSRIQVAAAAADLLPLGANSGHPFQEEKRPMTLAEEEASRTSACGTPSRQRLGPLGPYKRSRRIHLKIPSMTLRPRRQQRHLMATASGGRFGQQLPPIAFSACGDGATTASKLEYSTAVLFPRPGSSTRQR